MWEWIKSKAKYIISFCVGIFTALFFVWARRNNTDTRRSSRIDNADRQFKESTGRSEELTERIRDKSSASAECIERAGDAITRAEESLSTAEDIVRRGIERARKEK